MTYSRGWREGGYILWRGIRQGHTATIIYNRIQKREEEYIQLLDFFLPYVVISNIGNRWQAVIQEHLTLYIKNEEHTNIITNLGWSQGNSARPQGQGNPPFVIPPYYAVFECDEASQGQGQLKRSIYPNYKKHDPWIHGNWTIAIYGGGRLMHSDRGL